MSFALETDVSDMNAIIKTVKDGELDKPENITMKMTRSALFDLLK